MKKLLSLIQKSVEKHADELAALAEELESMPERGFQEFRTQERLARKLFDLGLAVEWFDGITGFQAVLDTGRPGPAIAILCELDAINCPEHPKSASEHGFAHACGHHVQMAAAIGAMEVLLNSTVSDDLCGRIVLVAVPAEEYTDIETREKRRQEGKLTFYGGKQECIARGLFNEVDMAIMIHSLAMEATVAFGEGMNGMMTKNVRIQGKATHAAGAPELGINALFAANLGLDALNALRETFRDEDHVRVHGILTKGGDFIASTPSQVELEIMVRAANSTALQDAAEKVDRAFGGGAYAMGATVEIKTIPGYLPLRPDEKLSALGLRVSEKLFGADKVRRLPFNCASTDLGDLGTLMPVIQPYIGGCAGGLHSAQFSVTDSRSYANGAALLAGMTATLLKEDAAEAKAILAAYHPRFHSAVEYTETQKQLFSQRQLP